jgi:alpha/beta superfamily hydrolase
MGESNASIRSLFIGSTVGKLEAVLNGGTDSAEYAALVCHPHPLYGGTMHNKVVYHAMKSLNALGLPVLRFNFRGAGLSEGEHESGIGEIGDVEAALQWLRSEFNKPIIFAGFSFGAAVGLGACCPAPDVKLLIALGLPIAAEGRNYDYRFLGECAKPKLFVSGDRDQFGSRAELEQVVKFAADPKQLTFINNADHFFAGQLPAMRQTIEQWLTSHLQVASNSITHER